jgi:outer membrane lipoprotein-sorting protein
VERDRSRLPVLVVAALALAAAGAGGLWVVVATEEADPVGLDAGERYAELDAVGATVVTVRERGGETSRTVAEVLRRPGTDRRRVDVVESTDRRYDLTVADGSTLWLYDSDRAVGKRIPLSGPPPDPTRGERVERLFARLNVTAGAGPTTVRAPTVSPLPVVPGAGGAPEPSAGRYRLTYDGTGSVDGRRAYVLSLTAGGGEYRQTLWVDTEWFYPLKTYTEWTADGQRVSLQTTYRNVTFDPDLPAGAFRFDPPASASVEAVDTPRTKAYDSVARLRADAEMSVPDPEVPPSLALTYASETTGRIRGVGLRYVNETARLTVAKYNRTVETDGDRQVTVAGRPAQLSLGSPLSLSWNCETYRFTVRGEGVSTDRLVAVGRSVGCA